MENCLVSKLKGIVDNPDLKKLDEYVLTLDKSGATSFTLRFNAPGTVSLVGRTFDDNTSSKSFAASETLYLNIKSGNVGDKLKFKPLSALEVFMPTSGEANSIKTSDFKYCENIERITPDANKNIRGSLSDFYNSMAVFSRAALSGGTTLITPTQGGLEEFFEAGWSRNRRSGDFQTNYSSGCFFVGYSDRTIFGDGKKVTATYSASGIEVKVYDTSNNVSLTATFDGTTWSFNP